MSSELDIYLRHLLQERYDKFIQSPAEHRAIRINGLKTSARNFEYVLKDLNYPINKLPCCRDGYVLQSDPLPLSHTLHYFTGQFMYQGMSSQIPANCLDIQPGDRILDIAAAPGSKSTQLASLMDNQGLLILNDYSTTRMQALNTNMQRCGAINYILLKHRGQDLGPLLPDYFDKVLCDVPCTATGTLSSHPEIHSWWTRAKLHKLANIQYYLLVSAIKTLKTGGELIYSTCSVTPEENEQVINRVLKTYPVEIMPVQNDINLSFERGLTSYQGESFTSGFKHAIRIFPDKHRMEGFFIIRLRKTGSTTHPERLVRTDWQDTLDLHHSTVCEILDEISGEWGIPQNQWSDFRFYRTKTRLWMLNEHIKSLPLNGFVSAGLLLAEKRITGWKMSTASVQFFSSLIDRRQLVLNDSELKELFKEGKIQHNASKEGYYALVYDDEPIASVFAADNQLKLRLPHSFNLIL